jgi:hypothetical protein
MRQDYNTIMEIPVRVVQLAAGMAIAVGVTVRPQGAVSARYAKAGECEVSLWEQSWTSEFSQISGWVQTGADGWVVFPTANRANDTYKIVARHRDSQAEVQKIFHVTGNAVDSEDALTVSNAGSEMPLGWS